MKRIYVRLDEEMSKQFLQIKHSGNAFILFSDTHILCIALIEGQKENKTEKGEKDLKATKKVERKDILELCPLCGSQLERGYIASMMIAWGDKKISDESFSGRIMGGGFVAFGAETIVSRGWPYPITNVEACRCKKCKLMIFRYGKT